ncbi:MAG TPA: DUF2635 domain-containing protein [Pseudomonas sp.]|uniref:DUF2635 domain-containing protein n=1 Tax=Pseudomonas sp. TaxID=306 RepID=UPI002C0CC2B2|nr:DUF2635 domain-containing protein [Pseudomonas sp.]HWH86355.1 DUF2635 domain-containing protein [Pseudomonas sp.]
MTKQYLIPTPGMKVRNPQGGYLRDEGQSVTMTPYWRRRIAEGGCALGEPPASVKSVEGQVETQPQNPPVSAEQLPAPEVGDGAPEQLPAGPTTEPSPEQVCEPVVTATAVPTPKTRQTKRKESV